ncbi:NADPH-dependent FMN reductase [Mucilaginibacter aquatilis]|uniref:NADPH-dependent FMN reductase n=1 Tax=Mucilaginibacter aquatilis TaxID=1517760 RepID=A0A6I4IBC5_9SPHI|nr:NAD(P)H-dependent oxidoreductase [Mucilaginibacter aquatilis]MVN92491.1 NADPH-dependent FMN reductase [Mucilaginibacter aquatilis]
MITVVAATNRPGSSTLKLAKYYQRQLIKKGLEVELLSLENLPPNFIQTDMYGKCSAEFGPIRKLINASQKFLFVIPEYNGSFPGVLKAFIDACDFPDSFYDKKAALVGHSSGTYGNIRGVEHFAGVCSYLHMHVLPLRIHIPFIRKEINAEGELFEERTLKFVNEQIEKFVTF